MHKIETEAKKILSKNTWSFQVEGEVDEAGGFFW